MKLAFGYEAWQEACIRGVSPGCPRSNASLVMHLQVGESREVVIVIAHSLSCIYRLKHCNNKRAL
eukprot:1366542-Amorphochlora_amoeboformis.AAC.1